MTPSCISCKKNVVQTKMLVSEELNKIDQCFYQIVLFVARKNRILLEMKKLADYY